MGINDMIGKILCMSGVHSITIIEGEERINNGIGVDGKWKSRDIIEKCNRCGKQTITGFSTTNNNNNNNNNNEWLSKPEYVGELKYVDRKVIPKILPKGYTFSEVGEEDGIKYNRYPKEYVLRDPNGNIIDNIPDDVEIPEQECGFTIEGGTGKITRISNNIWAMDLGVIKDKNGSVVEFKGMEMPSININSDDNKDNIIKKEMNNMVDEKQEKEKQKYYAKPENVDTEEFVPLVMYRTDTYFWDEDEVIDYAYENDTNIKDMMLMLCEPQIAREIEPNEYYNDYLADDLGLEDVAKTLYDKIEEVNEYIRNKKPILSWTEGKFRLNEKEVDRLQHILDEDRLT